MKEKFTNIQHKIQLSSIPDSSSEILVSVQASYSSDIVPPQQHIILGLDISGSMSKSNKLPLLKKAAIKTINEFLAPNDFVSVIVFNDQAAVIINSVKKSDFNLTHQSRIESLQAGGFTAIEKALKKVTTTPATTCLVNSEDAKELLSANLEKVEYTCEEEEEDEFISKTNEVFNDLKTNYHQSNSYFINRFGQHGSKKRLIKIEYNNETHSFLLINFRGTYLSKKIADEAQINEYIKILIKEFEKNQHIVITDIKNTTFFLVSDGQNSDKNYTADKMISDIKQNCGGNTFNIVPIGIVDCSDTLYDGLSQGTGGRALNFYIKSPELIGSVFDNIHEMKLFGMKSEPVLCSVSAEGANIFQESVGALSPDQPGATVKKLTFDSLKGKTIQLTSNLGGQPVTVDIPEDINNIVESRDILASHVNQLLSVRNDNKTSIDRAITIQNEILPLISPPRNDDSAWVLTVRRRTIDAYYVFLQADKNAIRFIVSTAQQSQAGSKRGERSQAGNKQLECNSHNTSVINGADHLIIDTIKGRTISQQLDWVNSEDRYLFSVDADPYQRELLFMDRQSSTLQNCVRQFSQNKLKQISINLPFSEQNKTFSFNNLLSNLDFLAEYVLTILPGRDLNKITNEQKTSRFYLLNEKATTALEPVIIDKFINAGQGLCRHMSMLTCFLLAQLIKNNSKEFILGKVRHHRGTTVDGQLAHSWVVYSYHYQQNHQEFTTRILIDSTGIVKKCYDLTDETDRNQAIQDYAHRGLAGVLEPCLRSYGLPFQQTSISAELIALVKDDQPFIDENLVDPISREVMSDPVSLEGHLFDRQSILTWLQQCESRRKAFTNPLTNKICSFELKDKPDIKEKIILKILQQNGYVPPEQKVEQVEAAIMQEKLTEIDYDQLDAAITRKKLKLEAGIKELVVIRDEQEFGESIDENIIKDRLKRSHAQITLPAKIQHTIPIVSTNQNNNNADTTKPSQHEVTTIDSDYINPNQKNVVTTNPVQPLETEINSDKINPKQKKALEELHARIKELQDSKPDIYSHLLQPINTMIKAIKANDMTQEQKINAIQQFEQACLPYISSKQGYLILGALIGAIIGAAIGFVIGNVAGAAIGSKLGASAGAGIGSIVAGVLLGLGGGYVGKQCAFFALQTPLDKMNTAANNYVHTLSA